MHISSPTPPFPATVGKSPPAVSSFLAAAGTPAAEEPAGPAGPSTALASSLMRNSAEDPPSPVHNASVSLHTPADMKKNWVENVSFAVAFHCILSHINEKVIVCLMIT